MSSTVPVGITPDIHWLIKALSNLEMQRQSVPYSPPTLVALFSITLIVSGVLFSACDSGSGGESGIAGTYSVVSLSIDGGTVPSENIEGAQLVLEGDGTWTGSLELIDYYIEKDVITGQGEYNVSDQTVIFSLNVSNVEDIDKVTGVTGNVEGERLEVTLNSSDGGEDAEAVFEKD